MTLSFRVQTLFDVQDGHEYKQEHAITFGGRHLTVKQRLFYSLCMELLQTL